MALAQTTFLLLLVMCRVRKCTESSMSWHIHVSKTDLSFMQPSARILGFQSEVALLCLISSCHFSFNSNLSFLLFELASLKTRIPH